ncbi:response regulator transcription factor [Alcaligenaceae bacterium LF4-65]|uniref:Response regulator transcription factor n=1 Tax=Zwartia hollandica TaxID=324606 RepID=A0A953NBN8_9BURK|nr:response regulator transcription factor [Zwartia hollandica]MBZ1351372.1 response regulator transcription factor [Zwartia hollandica]
MIGENTSALAVQSLRIALVEDDPLLRKEIHYHLKQQGFIVYALDSGLSLDQLLLTEPIDALVLDLNLPGEDGLSIARRMRIGIPSVVIIMLTARTAIPERLKGYEAGADIYLSKPIAPEELTAALLSQYRRAQQNSVPSPSLMLSLQHLSLTSTTTQQKVYLTNSEKVFLIALAQATHHLLESEVICEILCQRAGVTNIGRRSLESLVSRLRKKIATVIPPDAESPIKAVWGVGYQLCVPVDLQA